MKKRMGLLLAVLLMLGLAACTPASAGQEATLPPQTPTAAPAEATDAPTQAPAEAEVSIFGVDLTALTPEAAVTRLNTALAEYVLTLTVNGKEIPITAQDLELAAVPEGLTAYLEAAQAGTTPDTAGILSYNADNLREAITGSFDRAAQNAQIVFRDGQFVLQQAHGGQYIDPQPAVDAAEAAIAQLAPTAEATVSISSTDPTLQATSAQAEQALARANSYLDITLAYSFTPDGGTTRTETISKATLAGFLQFDGALNAGLDMAAIRSFAKQMNTKYQTPAEQGKFVTTGGGTINIDVTYEGQQVDEAALRDDLVYCITNRVSGTRTAPYAPKQEAQAVSFGGNYIEVSLSAQHAWVYKDGECVVSTPIVSGCVFTGDNTPTGVYKVNKKARNTVLRGADYTEYVSYWVGFIGRSYGLHDASWRDSFGGDIYLYEGSHGCVNVPDAGMAAIYNNVSVGTTVVLYGGASNAKPVTQTLSGTAACTLATDSEPLQLDAAPQYPVEKLTYVSSDPAVAKVSADGTVTPVGAGTAIITVTAPAQQYYTAAELKVTVTVQTPCEQGRHRFTQYDITLAPTCEAEGSEKAECDLCGAVDVRIAAPTGHAFGDGPLCGNGCGKENPDYRPPETEAPTEEATQTPTE